MKRFVFALAAVGALTASLLSSGRADAVSIAGSAGIRSADVLGLAETVQYGSDRHGRRGGGMMQGGGGHHSGMMRRGGGRHSDMMRGGERHRGGMMRGSRGHRRGDEGRH